ncbi:aspartate/glutamate racemase family protein [Azospirillum doebereinerae]|uniref:maleate cis-trans isomerase family protein n=1 Tax=Azospirillum doebereinerae TaxID=92933 RepID=UPI001EE57A3D|nr:aspartate/glutamate racemase family protein [Azospirillum doebereinerae]MCG5241423.1 aspartate/glutamate racemase family protein [Azospirillum doebereinerae]
MTKRVLLGMLTPSSNTVLEPVTSAMLSGLPEVSAHFGRFTVKEISLRAAALDQFTDAPFLDAARLLADARLNVIGWNGTSAGWLGFDADVKLCRTIETETGIPACTSMLALNEILETTGRKRFAIVSPYLDEIQETMVANYNAAGFEVVAERHLNDRGNFSFSEVSEERIERMCAEVAEAKPDAIAIICTNMRGAPVAERVEKALGIPVYDTVSTVVWKALRMTGVDTRRVQGWGSLFQELHG